MQEPEPGDEPPAERTRTASHAGANTAVGSLNLRRLVLVDTEASTSVDASKRLAWARLEHSWARTTESLNYDVLCKIGNGYTSLDVTSSDAALCEASILSSMKLSPYTYINANLSDHGITAAKLVEMVSSFAHAQGVTRVDLSGNLISGSKYKNGSKYQGVETYDTDVSGIEALGAIKVKSLIMRGCELGPKAVTALSSTLSKVAVVDILANPIGEDGFKTLIELFESTPRIQSMCGVQHGTRAADFSQRGLKPIDVKIIAHELGSSRSMAGVARVDLSGNGLSGATFYESGIVRGGVDSDLAGITALCEALPSSKITELLISKCSLGPKSIAIVASTLVTAGLEVVDISENLISGTTYKHDRHGSATKTYNGGVDYDTNVSGIEALSTIKVKSLIMRGCELGPKAIAALSSILATAGVERMDISENLISGSKYKSDFMGRATKESNGGVVYDTDVSGIEALSTIKVNCLIMRSCVLGPKAVTALSSILATAGVETVDLSNNRFDPSLLDGIKHKVKLNLAGCRA